MESNICLKCGGRMFPNSDGDMECFNCGKVIYDKIAQPIKSRGNSLRGRKAFIPEGERRNYNEANM